jgi:site-specific recombinase XerD
MASLQLKGDTWYCQFMFKRERHTFTVGKVEESEARAVAAKVDYWLMRVRQNLVQIPPGCTLLDFVRYDGKPPDQPTPEKKLFTLANLRDEYLTLHAKVLDARTVGDMKGHWKHLTRLLGEKEAAEMLTLAALQNYVIARVGEGVEGATAKKEVVTLRTCWNWAVRMDMLKGAFPNKGLRFPKGQEKPPFMTFAEVTRRVAAGASEELWESVFLTRPEIEQLLQCVDEKAAYPWVAPMFWFAAHAGARRSELLRVQKDDIDLEAGTVLVREKKRRRDVRESTRRVPLSDALKERLRKWLTDHPGGPYLFCHSYTNPVGLSGCVEWIGSNDPKEEPDST